MIQHSFHKKSAGSWFFTSRSQLQSFKSFSWLFRCWKVFDLFKFLTCSTGSISALRPSYRENWCIWGDVRKKLPWCCSPANPTISFIWHMHTYVMNWKSLDWIWLDLDWFFSSSLVWYVFTWTRSCMVNLNISAPQLTLDRPPFAWAWTAQLGPQFRFVSNSAYSTAPNWHKTHPKSKCFDTQLSSFAAEAIDPMTGGEKVHAAQSRSQTKSCKSCSEMHCNVISEVICGCVPHFRHC